VYRFVRMIVSLFVSLGFVAGFVGCGSTDDQQNGPGGTERGAIVGQVQGLQSSSAVQATVAYGGETTRANEQGWFFIQTPDVGERKTVEIDADGFVGTQRITDVGVGERTFIDARLFAQAEPQELDVASGGELQFPDARVDIPANALEAGSGGGTPGETARVSLTNVDPSIAGADRATPGDYTTLPGEQSEPGRLETYGMAELTITDAEGDALAISEGSEAQLEIPVAEQLAGSSNLPEQLNLWRYDESEGRWTEDGTASYSAESECYQATVSGDTSTFWMPGQRYEETCLTGRVVSPDTGEPASGVEITARGVGYVGTSRTRTASDGTFSVEVMRSSEDRQVGVEIQAQSGGFTLESPKVVEQTPTTSDCGDVGTIELEAPAARIALGWSDNPSDLDSHLTGPRAEGDGRFHMFFSRSEIQGNDGRHVFLDTDDTTGRGPEVTSVLERVPGTYVYSVKNYSGESDHPIADSEASVQAFLPNQFREFEIADADNNIGAEGDASYPLWRVFRFEIDEDGQFGSFTPINEIVSGGGTTGPGDNFPGYHPEGYNPEGGSF